MRRSRLGLTPIRSSRVISNRLGISLSDRLMRTFCRLKTKSSIVCTARVAEAKMITATAQDFLRSDRTEATGAS